MRDWKESQNELKKQLGKLLLELKVEQSFTGQKTKAKSKGQFQAKIRELLHGKLDASKQPIKEVEQKPNILKNKQELYLKRVSLMNK